MRPWYLPQFAADIDRWIAENIVIARRVARLVDATLQAPNGGPGKPKRLTGVPTIWSRRITRTHRLYYSLCDDGYIEFLQCYGHDLPAHVREEKRREAAREGAA